MTVGFNEDRKFDGIDGSATVAITGADEDILAVGEIEAGKLDENTDVKAIGVNLVGLSCWLSDLVDELKIDYISQCTVGFHNLNKNSQEVSHFSHVKW